MPFQRPLTTVELCHNFCTKAILHKGCFFDGIKEEFALIGVAEAWIDGVVGLFYFIGQFAHIGGNFLGKFH